MKNLVLVGFFVVVSLLACIGIAYTASLEGSTSNTWGSAVRGYATASSGYTIGVFGLSYSSQGYGVLGYNTGWSGGGIGIWGISLSPTGTAIKGTTFSQIGLAYGVVGESRSPRGIGVLGLNYAGSGNGIGIKGTTNSPDGYPGYFDGGQGIKIPVRDTDPTNPAEGTIWINRKETALKMRVNGMTVALKGSAPDQGKIPGGKIWVDEVVGLFYQADGAELYYLSGEQWERN